MNPLAPMGEHRIQVSTRRTWDQYRPHSFEAIFSARVFIGLILAHAPLTKEYLSKRDMRYTSYLSSLQVGDRVFVSEYEQGEIISIGESISVQMNNGKTLEFNVDTGKSQSTYRWPPIPDDEWNHFTDVPYKIEFPDDSLGLRDEDHILDPTTRRVLKELKNIGGLENRYIKVDGREYAILEEMGEYFVVLNSLDKTGKKPTYGFFHRSRADNYGEVEF